MKPRRCLCVLLGIGALSWATPAAAATITVTGTDGAPGIDGTAGGDGGPGGPGGDATATATGPDTSNSADATGGTGGAGGAGSPPGIDGAGGMGGHAQASASASGSSGDVNVSATAQGGTGGTGTSGGQGGTADIGLVSGSSTSDGLLVVGATASGGDGGVALSSSNAAIGHQGDGGSSSIVNAISASGPGTLVIGQSATGGNAGRDPSGTSQAGAGVGGNASSSLTLTLPTISSYAQVISFAQGGAGSEGEASPGRTVGNGGNGTAFLDLTTSDRPTYAQANSYGGQGIGLGNGGAASSVSHLHLVGDGLFGSVQSNATGGDGGVGFCAHGGDFCRGGDATSISTADAVGNSPSSSQSFAYGGAGGSADPASAVRQDGARGGDATASASATSPDSAQAGAGAYGGAGGDGAGPGSLGGAGGTASASAFASAPSSASAGVSVTGGRGGGGAGGAARGGDVDLENVPVAESPGQVSLSQGAYGGDSGPGPGSRGGDARSVLTVSGVPTGTLSIEADAAGGTASGTDGSARGGNASVVADAIGSGSQNVYVSAGVTAGTIADGIGTPGTATLERVHGSSDTGAVSVYGWVTGGGWPNGISVDLVDGVQGETAGSLSLTQAAYGGDSLTSAGNASSRLHHDGSSTSLLVQTDANGGNVSDSNPNGGHLVTLSGGGTGAALTGVQQAGAAFAESEGTNTGDTGASAYAVGGSTPRGIAGDAEADATAHGLGGAPGAQVTASSAAYAGQVSDIYSAGPGQGGSARAVSLATAENAAPGSVTSSATASGGLTPAAGSGGTAVAEATSISTATGSAQQITASAAAYGGAVLSLPNDQGISFPTSVAAAASTATAQGLASRLLAEATTIGGSDSTATSHLLTERDALVGLHAQLAASDGIQSAVHTTALAGLQESLSDARNRALGTSGAHAGAYLSSVESPLTSWVTGNTNVMNSLSQGGTIVAQGLFTSDLSQDWTGSTTVELDRSQLKGSTPFRIGLLDPEIPTVGLDLLEVHISVDGNPVADMTFNSAAAAAAALDDQLVTVDPSNVGTGPIARIVVGMVLHASAATGTEVFLSNFVVIAPVPEPAVWMLVALGALVLGARRLTTGALILAAQRLTRGTFRAVIPGVVERRALCVLLSAGMACVPGLSLVASSADAASIAISGTNGTPGVDGAPGNPGRNGTAGGAGGDANATSAGLDPSNSATATGGAGGAGGKGGNAQPSSGVPGNGGAGGAGGNATASATATTEDPDTFTAVSTATATGGVGGAGGLGGTSSGSPGATGAGGAGGNAYALADGGPGNSTAVAVATGGNGGTGGVGAVGGSADGQAHAAGGNATASLTARAGDSTAGSNGLTPAGTPVSLVNRVSAESLDRIFLTQDAEGGNGSLGGAARSELTIERDGNLDIQVRAQAGNNVGVGPVGPTDGSDATVHVDATGGSGKSVTIVAEADGGDGSSGKKGGSGILETVVGRSGTGSVDVTGISHAGSGSSATSVALDGAVDAFSTGPITLTQEAIQPNSGSASSVLHRTKSALSLSVSTGALGGTGSSLLADSEAANDAGSSAAQATAGSFPLVAYTPDPGLASDGTARARAESSGNGQSATASSSAVGRNAATALSTASAGHLGNASVNAFANAVVPDPGGTTPFVGLGQATAEGTTDYLLHSFAEARGHGGSFATATAHSTEGVLPLVMSTVTANTGALAADLRSDVKLRASTSELAQLATSGPATVVEAMPFYDPRPLIGGFPTIESSLDATSKIVALAAFTSGVGKSGLSNSDWSGEFRFGVDRSLLLSPDLSLGFLGVNVPEVGFDAMSLHISVDGAPVADFSFTDPETVRSTLQDHVVHVDLPASSPSDIATLVVSLDAHMLPQSYVFAGFALIAHTTSPEPAGLALCVLGIGLLAARRWLFA